MSYYMCVINKLHFTMILSIFGDLGDHNNIRLIVVGLVVSNCVFYWRNSNKYNFVLLQNLYAILDKAVCDLLVWLLVMHNTYCMYTFHFKYMGCLYGRSQTWLDHFTYHHWKALQDSLQRCLAVKWHFCMWKGKLFMLLSTAAAFLDGKVKCHIYCSCSNHSTGNDSGYSLSIQIIQSLNKWNPLLHSEFCSNRMYTLDKIYNSYISQIKKWQLIYILERILFIGSQ